MQEHQNMSDTDATKIFRVPTTDATSPNLMGTQEVAAPTLTIVKGPQVGMTFTLNGDVVTIGRDPSNSVFLNDMTISRNHAKINLLHDDYGMATIEDLDSLNGTWVDGTIINKAILQDGSTIQIGTFRMVFNTRKPGRIQTGQ